MGTADEAADGEFPPLREAAWRYAAGGQRPEELPMVAAWALVAGLDSPALRELAGLPRTEPPAALREVFERALRECGIGLPGRAPARRYALRRAAAAYLAGEAALKDLVRDEWGDTEPRTAEERASWR